MEKTRKFLGGGGGGLAACPPGEIWSSEPCISSMLEQKLEFLDRRQISLNFSFFNQ